MASASPSGPEDTPRSKHTSTRLTKRQKERVFVRQHAALLLLLGFFVILHALGVYLFTNGFLLARFVLTQRSQCDVPPISAPENSNIGDTALASASLGCWHPKTFNKAVVILIDALRYDFTVPFVPSPEQATPQPFHNSLPILYNLATRHPQNAFLRPFIADPPTTTLQRLKALTTGTLPTFIDAGSNFAGTAIDEDNLIEQLVLANKNVVHLGDDTWHSLFPGYFEPNLTRPFPSLEVWDLHTVDNGVIDNLFPILETSVPGDPRWDVLIGHFLGVDHAGHRYGPDHPAMTAKLQQMNGVLERTINLIDEETLLVVMGDHGMDTKGDHGGESDQEVEAALWMYSKKPAFGRSKPEFVVPPATAKERFVGQIDLVPTLALLLGLPIPFNNLGAPIEEAFIGVDGKDWDNLALVNRLTAAQIHDYQTEYALVREPDPAVIAIPTQLWAAARKAWQAVVAADFKFSSQQWQDVSSTYASYCEKTLRVFRSLWTQFGPVSMVAGIAVSTLSLLALFAALRIGSATAFINALPGGILRASIASVLGGGIGFVVGNSVPELEAWSASFFGAAFLSVVYLISFFFFLQHSAVASSSQKHNVTASIIPIPLPRSIWSWTSVICTLLLSVGFASNSYTIWEDEILLFFLGVFGTLMFVQCCRIGESAQRFSTCLHVVLFMVAVRLESLSRLCREEQSRHCKTTFYASATSTTSSPWQIVIPYVVAIALPALLRHWYERTESYHGSAVFWIGVVFRLTLLLVAVFWTLNAADDGDWLVAVSKSALKTGRTYLAQFIVAVAVGAGTGTFAWQAPFIRVVSTRKPGTPYRTRPSNLLPKSKDSSTASTARTNSAAEAETRTAPAPIEVHGLRNLYGSHFATLPLTIVLLPLLLFAKPMGQYALALTTAAILSLLEVLPHLHSATAGPVVLALLGHFTFFKTGHQAALASIQWDSAYVALSTMRMPWSALFVLLNTFAGQILCAAAVPLVVLWRKAYVLPSASDARPEGTEHSERSEAPQAREGETARAHLLKDLAAAHLTHIAVYATVNLATTLWAAHLRRHLMLYRVFCPRWMLGSAALLVVELVGLLVGIGGVGCSVRSIAELFGW